MNNVIKDYLLKEILPKINAKGIFSLAENADHTNLNAKYFDEFFQFSKTAQMHPSKDLAECVKISKEEIKKAAREKSTGEAIKGKRELTYEEMININIGDYVSHCNNKKEFIKGKVIEIREKTYLIQSKEGTEEVPKDYTIRFFKGQKFDAREIGYNFLNLNLGKQDVKEIDLNNIIRNFNLNAKYLTFSDLDKKNRLLLLKGRETGVIGINVKIEQNGKIVTKSEKIRLNAYRYDNQIVLQKIKGFDKSIYNRPINAEEISRLKSGETIIYRGLETKEKQLFDVAAYYDKGLDQIRVKSLNEKNLEKLTVLSDYVLSRDELNILNTKGELGISRINRNGNEIRYTLMYNKPLNELKIKKADINKAEIALKNTKPSHKQQRAQKQEDYLEKQKQNLNRQRL